MQHDEASDMQDDDMNLDEVLADIKDRYKKQSPPIKRSWMTKLKGFFIPGQSELKDPVVQTKTRGRPSVKKSTIKKFVLPDLNETPQQSQAPSSLAKSKSMHSQHRSTPDLSQPGRHSSYLGSLRQFEVSISEIPKVFHPYVRRLVDVKGDGNCGFRALAVAMGLDQQQYYEWVRAEMLAEYEHNKMFYDDKFSAQDRIYQNLQFSGEPRPFGKWMQIPEAGVLIANRFGMIVICISLDESTTVFPFWVGPEEVAEHRVISIALVHDKMHYVMVELSSDFPMPRITPYWTDSRNIVPAAARWADVYRDRLDHYHRLTIRSPVYLAVSDDD